MAYYVWQGITIEGKMCHGHDVAVTQEQLHTFLLHRNIALLKAQKLWIPYVRMPSWEQQAEVFERLSLLISVGVPIYEACMIAVQQGASRALKEALLDIALYINKGISVADACAKQRVFDTVIQSLLAAGDAAGKLSHMFNECAIYARTQEQLHKTFTKLLIGPAITLMLFLSICSIALLVIVPAFSQLYLVMHQELPMSTQLLCMVSTLCLQYIHIVFILVFSGISLLGFRIFRYGLQSLRSWLYLMPRGAALSHYAEGFMFFKKLSVLLDAGLPIMTAYQTIMVSTNKKDILHSELHTAIESLQHGASLLDAWNMGNKRWYNAEISAMLAVADKSGSLSSVCSMLACDYKRRFEHISGVLIAWVQPIFMILLGLLLIALVILLYLPICKMITLDPYQLS